MRTIQRDIVAAVIESSDGFLLFGKSIKGGVYQDCWIIPGGGIDEGETREQALHREIMEETGIDISSALVQPITDWRTGTAEKTLRDTGERVMVEMKFYDYHAILKTTKYETRLRANDDVEDLTWFAKSDLANLTFSPPTIELLQEMGYLAKM